VNDTQTHQVLIYDKTSQDVERLMQLLKDSAFTVIRIENSQEAFQFCLSSRPDLIIFDIKNGGSDGSNFFHQVKNQYVTHQIPLLLTTEETNFKKRIEFLEMGIDDFVTKPYYPEEVIARIVGLFQEFKPPALPSKSVDQGFVGSLKEMNLIDLIQTMELGNKSGIINLNRGDKEGQIYVNKGKIVDAVVEDYDAVERAYLHMLTWIEGSFYVIFREINLESPLQDDNESLFGEGAQVIDQWRRVIGELPSLHTCLVSVSTENAPTLSYAEKAMLTQFQDPKSILQAIDYSDFDDFDGLKIIKSLLEKGLLIKTEIQGANQNEEEPAFRPVLNNVNRDAKSKYSHIFSIFQRSKKNNKTTDFHSSMSHGEKSHLEKITPKSRIANNVQLTKAELLLIRQKLGK